MGDRSIEVRIWHGGGEQSLGVRTLVEWGGGISLESGGTIEVLICAKHG